MIFQNFNVFPNMTVLGEHYAGAHFGKKKALRTGRSERLWRCWEAGWSLLEKRGNIPAKLSGE